MNAKVLRRLDDAVMFHCPGCQEQHMIYVVQTTDCGPHAVWGFNGDDVAPTFSPSILVRGTLPIKDEDHAAWMRDRTPLPPPIPYVCHSFVTNGQIQFLNDCTHHLAGQTVPLPEFPEV